jgi:hypothetical protein
MHATTELGLTGKVASVRKAGSDEEAGMQAGPTRMDDACRGRRELQGLRLLREDAARLASTGIEAGANPAGGGKWRRKMRSRARDPSGH